MAISRTGLAGDLYKYSSVGRKEISMKSIKLILNFGDDENPLLIVERLCYAYEKEHFEFPNIEIVDEDKVREEYNSKF